MRKILIFTLALFFGILYSQNPKAIDSLTQVLKIANEDTNKVNVLNSLSKRLNNTGDYNTSLQFANTAKTLALKLKFKKGGAIASNNIGSVYFLQGNYLESLKNFFTTLKIMEELGDKKGMANAYNNIGIIYKNQDNLPEAMKNQLAALKIREEIGDKGGIANSYNNIGLVFFVQKNYSEALKNHFPALKIYKEIGNKKGIAASYNNLGIVYKGQGNYNEALINHFASLKIKEEMGDKGGIAQSLGNIGATYLDLKTYVEAESYTIKANNLFNEIGDLTGIKESNECLSKIYLTTGRHKKSLESYKAYITARDSLNNEENTKQTVRLEMQYDFDKKEAATKLVQEKKEAIAASENKKQKIIILSVCSILFLVICFAVFAYRSFLHKQKANEEITKQKEVIEEKQKEILDSIYYAKHIQTALLPSHKYIERNLNKLMSAN